MYVSSLTPSSQGLAPEASTSRTDLSNGGVPPAASLNDMVLVRVVGQLFEKTDDELQKEVNSIKKVCTEKVSSKHERSVCF